MFIVVEEVSDTRKLAFDTEMEARAYAKFLELANGFQYKVCSVGDDSRD